jgi:hypothetical protein
MVAGGPSNRMGSHCAASSSPEMDAGGEADAFVLQGEEHISAGPRGWLRVVSGTTGFGSGAMLHNTEKAREGAST